ncbi:MAG: type II toxin-antitoxin system HicB family antitoxin [Candidatus Pacebacteria bacterium]|nr:type II toxin-antitoxin system HicB family antitoxin [Candidatus Paceibacterota bacterium]
MKKLKMTVSLPVSIFKEGKNYVAFTPVLDLSTSASTYEKAKQRFNEAVAIFLEETIKQGTLEENLKNLGWSR